MQGGLSDASATYFLAQLDGPLHSRPCVLELGAVSGSAMVDFKCTRQNVKKSLRKSLHACCHDPRAIGRSMLGHGHSTGSCSIVQQTLVPAMADEPMCAEEHRGGYRKLAFASFKQPYWQEHTDFDWTATSCLHLVPSLLESRCM